MSSRNTMSVLALVAAGALACAGCAAQSDDAVKDHETSTSEGAPAQVDPALGAATHDEATPAAAPAEDPAALATEERTGEAEQSWGWGRGWGFGHGWGGWGGWG